MSRDGDVIRGVTSEGASKGDTMLWVGLLWAACVLLIIALLVASAFFCARLKARETRKLPTRLISPDGKAPR